MNNELSDDEIGIVAKSLSKLEPGYLPLPIFHEVTRLTTTPIIEIVPLRRRENSIQILLLKRESDDPVWPNQLHIPGTVVRATDTLDSALERILTKELSSTATSKPKFVKSILHHSGRGMESSQIYWVDVIGEATAGQFYDVKNLPKTIVASQMDFIPAAIDDYVK